MHGISSSLKRAQSRLRRVLTATLPGGRRRATLGAALLLAVSTATVLGTANTPPTITSATVSPSSANEGQIVTLAVAFTDPDASDYHTVRLYWHDAPPTPVQVIQLPPGQLSFQVSHTYTDNVPPSSYIKITLYDRQTPPGTDPNDNAEAAGKDAIGVPIAVRNVEPQFIESSIRARRSATGLVVEGDVTDPSPVDILQVSGSVGREPVIEPMACAMGPGARHFRCEYPVAGAFIVYLAVQDDDDGVGSYQTRVR